MTEYIEREAASQIIDYAKQLTSGTYGLLSGTGKACYDGIMADILMNSTMNMNRNSALSAGQK